MTIGGATKLAIHGGPKAVTAECGDLFTWPIITSEDEEAVLDVVRRGAMSGNDITRLFEQEMADYFGTQYALGYCNGTASLLGAMWACGLQRGDEIIGQSLTYWASVMPAWSLGATIVFADIDPDTISLDPSDVERRITERTRAIVVTHNYGRPADMDGLLAVARRHSLKLIEDVSHAHGGLYKGRKLGTLGDVAAMSLMTGKGLPVGEAGMLVTNDRLIWERAIAFGFYERTGQSRFATAANEITDPGLTELAGLPLGGCKHRMNQMCAAMGRVQLRYYPERMAEIDRAMSRFWDLLEGTPGIRANRPPKGSGSTMAAWYFPQGHYVPEELGGLPVATFCEAVAAEGAPTGAGANMPLHLHPVFQKANVYGDGRPTAIAHSDRDVRQGPGSLRHTEAVPHRVFHVPWFKKDRPEAISQYADAFRKAAENADQLIGRA